MNTIRRLSKEKCPAVSTAEYFVHPLRMSQCLDKLENSDEYLIPAKHLENAISDKKVHVVSPYGSSLKATDITLFDVSSTIHSDLLNHLLNKDNNVSSPSYWSNLEQHTG